MKSKEKMVLSTDKKSKTAKKDIPKKPSSSSTTKKFVKKEQKEKIHFSLIDKSSEDLNDSADFISLQNKRKPIKNGKSPIELASAASKEPKKRTSQRSQSSSLPQTAPLSPTEALTRRRTRSSERKIQEAEQNGDADNLKFPNGSPVLPSFSGAASKGTSESKPAKCSSQESKKQTSQTLKLSKVKVEPPEKDEMLKQTPAKKLVKSEQVRSISTSEKERTVPATKRRSSRSRSKSSETSDSLNLSEKSSPKADTSGSKKVKRKKLYQESPKTPPVKHDQPPRKRAQKSPKQDRIPSKCVQRKNTEKKNENNVSSEMVTTETGKSPPNLQSLTGDKERISNSAANTSQNNSVKCPTCKDLIPEEGLGRHILMCLKNKYQVDAKSRLPVLSDREQFRKDEALARQIHEDMNKDLQSHKDSKSTEDLTFCHVCQKDLSHMNSMWKAKHINHCFDNTDEENARKKKKLAVNARQQVPVCPMCGKQFKTGALRRCHLKKCAQDLSISPEKAVKLIAEQEKNFKPSLPAPATSSSTSARSLRNKQNKLPDEQMQVALALSSSLFEEQKKLNEQLAETVKNIHQGVNRDLRKLKKSQKKASASMPLLLTISKEDQLARNAQRVDSIISEPVHTMHFPKQFPHSSLSLNYGDVYQLHENTSCSSSLHSFWSRASLMDSSLTPNLFYIQSLMPPIQLDKVTAGSRLKPLSAIPGRGLDKEDIPSVTDNLPDSSAVPSTQTAVLLAELAQSNEEDLDDEESSGSTFEPTQGFYLSQKASETPGTHENKALAVLSEDLCNLVNKPYLSDIEFIAADNSRVCAHQLLLSVRCPLILNLAVQRENHLVIDMKDVSHNALLAFLRYLYAGRVDFEKNVTADLLQLSRKFNLPQLAVICEKTLQALIDEACYTPSVESVAGDIPEPLEIGDDHLQGNEEVGSMTVDNNSLLEPNKEDMEFGESTSEKLCPLPGASQSKSPESTALRSSPNCSYRELPAALDEQIFMTITGPSDAEFSPEKQHNQKPPIPGYDLLTDCSTSVIEKAAEFIGKTSSCKNVPTPQDITYKTPTSLKLVEETVAEGRCLDAISEQNKSSLTQQVSAFQRELKSKKFPALISKDTESEGMLTSFGGLLSAKHFDRRCIDDDNISPSASHLIPATGYTEQTVSPTDRGCSNRSLLLAHHQEKEANLCEENSVNSNSVSGSMSGHEFDDSNELFSEAEDIGEESENLKVSEVNNEKLKAKAGLVDEFGEISNDSICFVSENQQHTLSTGMLSPALHLADTVCENSTDEDLASGGSAVKLTSSTNRPQIPFSKCTILNGNTISFHMTDTILEVSKDLKNSSNSPCMTAASPLSATSRRGQMKTTNLEGSASRCCPQPTKSLKEYSPISLLGRFNSATQDSGMGFGSEFEVRELNYKSSTSPKFSFSPLSGTRTDLEVRNLGSLRKDSANVHRNFQQRSKRKSCCADFLPSPKTPPRKRRNVLDVGSETTASHLKGCFTGTHFSKETGLQFSSFEEKNNTSYDAIDHLSNLASAGSLEMTAITSDLNKNSPGKLVSKNQTKTVEKWLALAEDNSPCDAEVSLSNSPGSILDRNLDMFSQLSEDSITEYKSDRDLKAGVPLENDSDLEMGLYSKNCTDFGANLERNPDCLHGSRSPKTLGTRGKKFTFKRTQLKNIKSPVICASSTLGHTPAKKKKSTGRLRSLSDDLGHLSDKVESDYEYQPDIWDDFEDNGHMEDFVELSSPTLQNLSTAENISAKKLDCKDSSFNSHFPTSPEVANEIANKESFNSSFINDFISSSSPEMSQMKDSLHLVVDTQKNSNSASHSAKTPVIANRKGRKKKPAIPSPFTPMPLYTQMTTPELKAEMKKHGCKQMPHEKMVAHLMDIYQKTHQYETDSDLDQSAIHLEAPSEMPHSSLGIARLQTRRNTQDCFLQAHNEKKSPVISKKPAAKLSKKAKSSALGSGVSAQRSSSESDSANVVDLDKSDAVGAYEESFMTNEDDIPCSQQQMSGSCDNLHDKLREFVLKSPEIYTKMILYEPIDFDQLKKKIAEAKIKCSIPKLLDFLDNQCITFAMNKEKQHHGSWKRRVARK